MQNRKLHRFIYRLRHQYITTNNVVLLVAACIAISWVWSSVQAVERNYQLQREVDDKYRQLQLAELQTDTFAYEQRYYQSREYLELESKRRLGLAQPGEKVLVLPPNTEKAKQADSGQEQALVVPPTETAPPPPMQQWLNFLFGGNRQGLQNKE